MNNKLLLKYTEATSEHSELIQKIFKAHTVICSNKININDIKEHNSIAFNQLKLIAYTIINNKYNVIKASYELQTVIFNMRQQTITYYYDPFTNTENFTFNDNTVLRKINDTWYIPTLPEGDILNE